MVTVRVTRRVSIITGLLYKVSSWITLRITIGVTVRVIYYKVVHAVTGHQAV